jgi:hypothetical protein
MMELCSRILGEHFCGIMSLPDNVPILGLLLAVLLCMAVALKQAFKHDRLIAEGRKDEIYDEMVK